MGSASPPAGLQQRGEGPRQPLLSPLRAREVRAAGSQSRLLADVADSFLAIPLERSAAIAAIGRRW